MGSYVKYKDSTLSPEELTEDLLSRMTLHGICGTIGTILPIPTA